MYILLTLITHSMGKGYIALSVCLSLCLSVPKHKQYGRVDHSQKNYYCVNNMKLTTFSMWEFSKNASFSSCSSLTSLVLL